MAQMSDYLENKLGEHVFRNTAYASPLGVYVALFRTDPTDANTGVEMSGFGYERVKGTFGIFVDGTSNNTVEVLFPAATADWVDVTHFGIMDAVTGGNLLMHQILAQPVSVLNTNNLRFPVGDLSIVFS